MTFKITIKSLFLLISAVTITLFLNSCGREYLISRDLNMIEKGKSIAETEEIVGRSPKEIFSIKHGEQNIDVGIYQMLYYQYSYTTGSGEHRVTHIVRLTNDFGIMYVDGKLYNTFWITDLNKQEDDLTQRVAPQIVEKYYEKFVKD